MAELSEIIQDIHDNIHTNGQNGITGQLLQTTLDGMAVGLSEQVSQLGQELQTEVLSVVITEQNKYWSSSGESLDTPYFDSSKKIPLSDMDTTNGIQLVSGTIRASGSSVPSAVFFDSNGDYIADSAYFVTVSAPNAIPKTEIPQNAVYVGFNRYYTQASDVFILGYGLTSEIEKMKSDISEQEQKVDKNTSVSKLVILPKEIYSIDGYISKTTGNYVQTADTFVCTPFIYIDKSVDIVVSHVSGESGLAELAFYDANKVFISAIAGESSNHTRTVEKSNIPSNAQYIRCSAHSSGMSDDTTIQAFSVNGIINDVDIVNVKNTVSVINSALKKNGNDIYVVENKYLEQGSGNLYSYNGFYTSDYILINKDCDIIIDGIGTWDTVCAIAFYNENKAYISDIPGTNSQTNIRVASQNIPSGAVYYRTCCKVDLSLPFADMVIINDNIQSFIERTEETNTELYDELSVNGGFFDYDSARKLPRNVLRTMVETASNGSVTVIWDNDGYPSMMYKIPLVSIGAFSSQLGDLSTPHPAFYVNGTLKRCIYVSMYMVSYVDGHPVSWCGLSPANNKSMQDHRTAIVAKGTGWHLETIFERSLVNLLCSKFIGPKPRSNSKYGMSSKAGFEFETCQRADGKIAGTETFGAKWINGTQPISWSHNNNRWGIYDIAGGLWRWTDLIKLVGGQIYMPNDNNFAAEESSWLATGIYLNVDDEHAISFNNQYVEAGSLLAQTSWRNVTCKSGYDTIEESIRKKLALLLVCPRLSSSDNAPLFDFDGGYWIKTDGTYYNMAGGAQEYTSSGLGSFLLSYSKTENHGNMGARMCFID